MERIQNKFEFFNQLAKDLKTETALHLPTPDLIKLSMISKKYRAFFKPMLDVRKLLHHVARGEHDAVKTMLEKDINLLFKKGRVTDCSGRTFEHISSFEYALWALDKHMWTMVLDCIPQNEAGKKVLVQLLSQYNKVKKEGVSYTLNGRTITEKHFNFEKTLIKELQTQVDSIQAPGDKNWDAINKQWREGVGGVQKLLPMHVVYEYCSDEPFYHIPHIPSPQTKPSKQWLSSPRPKPLKQFYNTITEKHENWFCVDSKLGIAFALYKGSGTGGAVSNYSGWQEASLMGLKLVINELTAVRGLYEARTTEFIHLESQLEEQIISINQPQGLSSLIYLMSFC
ncbi:MULTISPECIES: F-box protein [Legionella]|uniref:F-box protein n=1 Tax=Legionella resiliens TaxID=2905958 RepID=A0ABS8X646_9GAMM|nr:MULTISPECIES: F-box protein [unclassified Legionella]MCE0723828.1 F-box protein [Legionella sp. 9fVS26]MCE3532980.1 F-box protein [Legionella sp. 8cVS16]QLZ69171.1 hypothetical protein FOLKNPGA_01953 [Legionella sp. PC1000]